MASNSGIAFCVDLFGAGFQSLWYDGRYPTRTGLSLGLPWEGQVMEVSWNEVEMVGIATGTATRP